MKINMELNLSNLEKEDLFLFLNKMICLNYNLDYTLNILNEDKKAKIHKKYFKTVLKDKNSYRAFTYPYEKCVFIFFNENENIESLKWLIAHELTHANLRDNTYLKNILNLNLKRELSKNNIDNLEKYNDMIKNDTLHEEMLEEQICNEFATNMIGKNYDRLWWRKQFKKNI